jgi:hypothetical protein
LSPIASDCDFVAQVESGGVLVSCEDCDAVPFDWEETRKLARLLEAFGAAG